MIVRRSHSVPPVRQFREEMDRLFTDLFPGVRSQGSSQGRAFPAVNVWEDDDHLYVEAEVPGLRQTELEVSLLGNQLTLKGVREDQASEESTYHRRERVAVSFERTLRLPLDVEGDRVEASLKDGVVLVTLPKAKAAKPRKIAVAAE